MPRVRVDLLLLLAAGLAAAPAGLAQTAGQAAEPTAQTSSTQAAPAQVSPLDRPLSDKEKFKRQKELKNELKGPYKKWVNEDVRWIITDQELRAFKSLSNDEERDSFIENFWQRRNPDPDSPENEYKEEHYRRIAYANEHFAAGKPGWMTDRGHIYIAYGPPDNIESHEAGGSYDQTQDQATKGGRVTTYPFDTWHYRYIEGLGEDVKIEFVDRCMCGEYDMTIDPDEKNAMLHTPGNASDPTDGNNNNGQAPDQAQESRQFDRIEQIAKLEAAPQIKFADLESFLVNHKVLNGPFFPFEVRTDFVKVTEDTVLVPLTLQIKNRDITFSTKDGVSKGQVNVLGRVATISDHVVQTFEETLEVEQPSELMDKTLGESSVHWWALPLQPGRYRIDIAIKDVNNPDHVGTWAQGIVVPKFDDEKLSASSLILADEMQEVPTKQIGTGQFIIGNTFVRPRVSASSGDPVTFRRDQSLNFWMQIYNLGIDDKSKLNSATIQYQILNLATNKAILDYSENSRDMSKNSGNSDQLTIAKTMPLATVEPGKYQVRVTVNDGVSKEQVAQTAPFTVQ